MEYGEKIRKLRKLKGDNLETLGKKLNFNYSNLSKIERGKRKPTLELLQQISEIYNVPLSYFYGEEQELPKELKERQVKWMTFGEKMEKRNLTPEQIEEMVAFLDKLDQIKKS